MQHSIEELIRRINVMHDKAMLIHRLRHQFSPHSGKEYDKTTCDNLLADIQGIALLIAKDKDGEDIVTEMKPSKNKG